MEKNENIMPRLKYYGRNNGFNLEIRFRKAHVDVKFLICICVYKPPLDMWDLEVIPCVFTSY
jgi:hypothetical protein